MKHYRNKEQRKEGWKVAKLIDESRVWSDAHGNAEADERYGHLETSDIHPCQQTVKVRNAEAEEGDANNQVKTAAYKTTEERNNGINRVLVFVVHYPLTCPKESTESSEQNSGDRNTHSTQLTGS